MSTISIIVPIYNAEKYLCRCVDSILSQTYTDFELLLIDDGSNDNSAIICDEYEKKDSRVKVFHNQNQGVSKTRQFGIDRAQGEYTIHVDSDDWVEPNMLKELYSASTLSKADVVICDFYVDMGDSSIVIKQTPSSLDAKNVLRDMFFTLHGSLCNKLIKRTCYSTFGISFPQDFSLCEDLFVVCSILKNDVNITYLPQAFYHYIQDANDLSITKVSGSSYEYDVMLLDRFSELMKDELCLFDCRYKFMFDIISRAYNRKEFTSLQFMKKCGRYIASLRVKNIPFYYKLKLFLSCVGFFRVMVCIDNLKNRV